MKNTAFYNIHQQLGAKIVDFAGFTMPVQYSSIIDEHICVRNSVGIFDVSHMGEFEIRGKDALALIQKVTINDASKLTAGKVQYSAMCYPDGGIVDDLLVYRNKDYFMMVVNASNTVKDFEWIKSNIGNLDVEIKDKSDQISLLAVQGPKSIAALRKLTNTDLTAMQYYTFTHGELSGVEMIISRTGYTGELGFELYFESSRLTGEKIWKAIMEAGKEFAIKPIGLGARDTLRLEMGFCLYGNDIDQTTNPLDAGLSWITKLDKNTFIGRDALLKIKKKGIQRTLVGLILLEEKAFPRHGYEIQSNDRKIGDLTSGTVSPILAKGIGLGYVPIQNSEPGSLVDIIIRNKKIKAQVVKPPFIKK